MSSDWVKFRDNLLNNLKFDNVDEALKQSLTIHIKNDILPLAKESADSFISQIKEQARTETGWVKIRDLIVLPYIIYGGLWLIEQTVIKTVEETKKV